MRVTTGPVTRKRRKRTLKLAKGYFGHKSIGFKVAKQAVQKSLTYAFRDRKQLKRNFRRLWITRVNAALDKHQINYSNFIGALKKTKIAINRKMLSEIAIREPKTFDLIVKETKASLK